MTGHDDGRTIERLAADLRQANDRAARRDLENALLRAAVATRLSALVVQALCSRPDLDDVLGPFIKLAEELVKEIPP